MSSSIFKMPVHPAAEIFPMLDEEELNALAEDIKANGLVHPLVIKEGVLIDGRNRREACRRAGIEPTTVELDGQDPATYILSSNINRRHMTKSQRAMAVAMLFPEGEKRGRGQKGVLSTHFDKSHISHARTVLKWTPEVARNVLAGLKPLNEAYQEVQVLKDRAEAAPVRLEKLRAAAPDLADLVNDEKLGINEAMAALENRKTAERIRRQGTWDYLIELERLAKLLENDAQLKETITVLKEHRTECPTSKPITEILSIWSKGIKQIRESL